MECKDFKKYIFDDIDEKLNSAGIIKSKIQIYTIKIDDTILGMVGLGTIVKHKGAYISINPIIGIRHQQIEKLIAELRNVKYDTYKPATISQPIGYLMPQNKFYEYVFVMDQLNDAKKTLKSFGEDIEYYANKFFTENSNLSAICKTMTMNSFYLPINTEYRLAVCYYFLNDFEKLKEYIKNVMEERTDNKPSNFFAEYKEFSNKLLALVE